MQEAAQMRVCSQRLVCLIFSFDGIFLSTISGSKRGSKRKQTEMNHETNQSLSSFKLDQIFGKFLIVFSSLSITNS